MIKRKHILRTPPGKWFLTFLIHSWKKDSHTRTHIHACAHTHTDRHNSIVHNVQFTVAALEVGHFSHIIIRLLLSGTSASALPLSTWLIEENCKYKYFIASFYRGKWHIMGMHENVSTQNAARTLSLNSRLLLFFYFPCPPSFWICLT